MLDRLRLVEAEVSVCTFQDRDRRRVAQGFTRGINAMVLWALYKVNITNHSEPLQRRMGFRVLSMNSSCLVKCATYRFSTELGLGSRARVSP